MNVKCLQQFSLSLLEQNPSSHNSSSGGPASQGQVEPQNLGTHCSNAGNPGRISQQQLHEHELPPAVWFLRNAELIGSISCSCIPGSIARNNGNLKPMASSADCHSRFADVFQVTMWCTAKCTDFRFRVIAFVSFHSMHRHPATFVVLQSPV
jgi:hypothetical protein